MSRIAGPPPRISGASAFVTFGTISHRYLTIKDTSMPDLQAVNTTFGAYQIGLSRGLFTAYLCTMQRRIRHVSAIEGYQRWAATYDATPNPVVAMDRRFTLGFLGPRRGEHILDAGCGTGASLPSIVQAGARPVGIDFSVEMLRVARRRLPGVHLAAADLQRPLPLRPHRFDAALCALVGEHLADLPTVFAELRRVLLPGGRFVFSVYHPELAAAGAEANFEDAGTEYRLGAMRYTTGDYLTLLSDAGFRDLSYREFAGDDVLAAAIPNGARYLGRPMLLVLTARTAA
jgi:ubiquinone/menaquinone biosynthesis C-methylase UbiE